MEQTGGPAEHVVLGLGASFCCEGAAGVAGEAAGEIFAHVTVGHLLCAVHQHLGAIIELRNALHGEQQGESLLQRERVLCLAEEAVGIMVLDERHDMARVLIEVVVAERIVDAVEAVPPCVGLLVFGLVYAVEEGEVHNGFEVRVLLLQR